MSNFAAKFMCVIQAIETCFSKFKTELIDQETLAHIRPSIVNGKSTSNEIERVKRERELLNQ